MTQQKNLWLRSAAGAIITIIVTALCTVVTLSFSFGKNYGQMEIKITNLEQKEQEHETRIFALEHPSLK